MRAIAAALKKMKIHF